ncbi:MAG: ABC transporter substrate-binding protein [Pseudomonadota bacterium]
MQTFQIFDTSTTKDIKAVIKKLAYLSFFYFVITQCAVIAAERIISIGGSITEILYEFNLQDKIVAVDTTSQYPSDAQDKPNVGYMRTLSAEPIIALNPDLILYLEGSGPAETIDQLSQAGINMVMIPNEYSIEGVKNKVGLVADAVDMQEEGQQLISNISAQEKQLNDYLSDIDQQANVIFIMMFDESSAMVAGKDTGADNMISMAKGKNVVDNFKSYKPLGAESITQLAPDYVLTTERAVKSFNNKAEILNTPLLKLTPAAENQNIIVMDELLLLGYSPRVVNATNQLAEELHSQ